MANMNSKLRKMNKGFVDKIKEDSKVKPNSSKNGNENVDDRNNIQPLTLKEQLFKGNKITMDFIGADKEQGNLNNLQLVIFFNGKLKYASKKGVFTFKTVRKSVLKRNGWRVFCETENTDRIVFKDDKNYNKFIGFCTQVRDCVRIQEIFNDLCYNFIKEFEEEVEEEIEEVEEEIEEVEEEIEEVEDESNVG